MFVLISTDASSAWNSGGGVPPPAVGRRERLRIPGAILFFALINATISLAAEPERTSLPTIEIFAKSTVENSERLHSTKLPVPSREVPISVEALDENLIDQSGYLQLSDLLDIATSAISIASDGGIFNEVMLRGFSDSTFYRNGLNDSLGQLTSRTLVNIERVEILKGPNAALQGPGEPGGSINYVTKRPQSEPLLEASAEFGYFDALVLNVDATGPIGRRDNWQYRLVASRERGDTFRDFVKNNRWFVAPSLAWQPTLGIDVLASVEYVRDERLLDTGVVALDGLPSLPSDRFLGEPASGPADIEGLTVQLSTSIRFDPGWEIGIDMQAQSTRVDGTAVEPSEFDGRKILREAQNRNEENDAWVVQIEAAGPLTIWNMRHDLLFGIEGTALNENVTLLSSDSGLNR